MTHKVINWFGEESHPTDSYIHWNNKQKEVKIKSKTLRKAYDKIISVGLKKELELLLVAAYNSGRLDEFDENNENI